jgi:peptidoglycan/LPS O-acetylase OafA/YrhL
VALYYDGIQAFLDRRMRISLTIASSMALVGIYVFTHPNDGSLLCDCVAICTAAIICSSSVTRNKSYAPMRALEGFGRLSYELYLFHLLIFWSLAPVGRMTLTTPAPHAAAVLLLIASIGLTYSISYAISRFFSEPLKRMIRGYRPAAQKLSGRMESDSRIGAAVSE